MGIKQDGGTEAQAYDSRPQRTVLIANLDTIRAKNRNQFRGMAPHKCQYVVLTTDSLNDSADIIADMENVEIVRVDASRVRRSFISSLLGLLKSRHFDLVEFYPYSHLALLMAILIKLRRIPMLAIARGDEYAYVSGRMPRLQAVSFGLTYRLADHVLYKEPYMAEMMSKLGKRSIWMLPNAVSVPNYAREHRADRCTFLFLNSISWWRHPEVPLQAFLQIAEELKLTSGSDVRMHIVGFGRDKSDAEMGQREEKLRAMVRDRDVPVELLSWTSEPVKSLDEADVFLLPSEMDFGNFGLLEAMSRGVPAIVQDTGAPDAPVQHGISGFNLPLDVDSWRKHMLRLIQDTPLRAELGRQARERVIESYSLEGYARRYSEIYDEILGHRTVSAERSPA